MIRHVSAESEGRAIEFQLDDETRHWVPVEPIESAYLEEADFPLIVLAEGKRYELYSDGTFGEVEL
jgi:predicted metal-dependent hydrolase